MYITSIKLIKTAIAISAISLISACNQNSQEDKLIGTWEADLGFAKNIIEYSDDHTYLALAKGIPDEKAKKGYWEINEGQIVHKEENRQSPQIMKIVLIDEEKLVVSSPTGDMQIIFKRLESNIIENSKENSANPSAESVEKTATGFAQDTTTLASVTPPFTGEKYFNLAGGRGTEYVLSISANGQAKVYHSNTPESPEYSGPLTSPINANGWLLAVKGNKIYEVDESGGIKHTCFDGEQECVSELY